MRQLTAYASYLDNIGAPLVGRARFYNLDGEPSVVYARDNATNQFIPNGTSVFTNSSGQLEPQVFLDNHDYLVVFDKYIGHGTMSEDDEQESWEEQGSAIDKYNTLGIILEGDSVRAIGTISELRETTGIEDGEVVMLLGYNSVGDKPEVNYVWNANSDEPDNAGSVIGSEPRGRWELVPIDGRLDVRHFGAFPLDRVVLNATQRYRTQAANAYARDNGLGIYFPASDTACYYDITHLALYNVDCNPAVRVFANTGTTDTTITGIEKIYCISGQYADGKITLIDDVVHSSWEGDSSHVSLSPTRTLAIDSEITSAGVGGISFSDLNIEILVHNTMTLTRCNLVSVGKISGPITMVGMEIMSSWFDNDYDYENDLNISDCALKLANLKSAQVYVALKNKQLENDYGDLGGQNVSGVTLAANCNASNARLVDVVLEGASEMRFVSGSVEVHGACNWNNCVIEVTNTSMFTIPSFAVRQSTVTARNVNGAMSCPMIDAEGSTLSIAIACASSTSADPSLRLIGCKLYKRITHTASRIIEDVERCEFLGTDRVNSGRIFINFPYSAYNDGQVFAKWIGNHAESPDPIKINRTYMKEADSDHVYVYEGNIGTFLPNKYTRVYEGVNFYGYVPPSVGQEDAPVTSNTIYYMSFNDGYCIVLRNTQSEPAWQQDEFFSVGTSDKFVKALFWIPPGVGWGVWARSIPVHLVAKHIQSADADAGGIINNNGNKYEFHCYKPTPGIFDWQFNPNDDVIDIPSLATTTKVAVDYELM